MRDQFKQFLLEYRDHFSVDERGIVREFAPLAASIATDLIIGSLAEDIRAGLPVWNNARDRQIGFSKWIRDQPEHVLQACDLGLKVPAGKVHYVRGAVKGVFYDFRNTDIVLEALRGAGVSVGGSVLDFGCSSGRSVAVLHRAYGDDLRLFGVDPAGSSIAWAKEHLPFAQFRTSRQHPPLEFEDQFFDLIIANSIWTHFSSGAAKQWFGEIVRVLRPGGHFVFSTHGPHDIAYRLTHNNNNPGDDFLLLAGEPPWTRGSFLAEVIRGLDESGFYFCPYKDIEHQGDLRNVENADTQDWGLSFMTCDFLRAELLPPDLQVLSRGIGRTGNRHDLYVVRKRERSPDTVST